MSSSFHTKFDMDAEMAFKDPQAIALCKAIEADDLKGIQRCIDRGADVNAVGKAGVTPLLWSFPDNKIDRFKLLLKNGADPNLCLTEDFGAKSVFKTGDAVLHLAARSQFAEHFSLVMHYGGDPNLYSSRGDTVIHEAIKGLVPNPRERIKLAVDHGADINALDRSGDTPLLLACHWASQYGLALYIMDLGGDPTIRQKGSIGNAITTALAFKRDVGEGAKVATPQKQMELDQFIQTLVDRGYNTVQAQADIERWGKLQRSKPGKPGWFAKQEAEDLAKRDEQERRSKDR